MAAPKYAVAETEYAKDPKLRKDDVQILLEWMHKQPHLPKISEFKVILFLQSCYYRIESAKTCIENFYTIRAHCPELFANRSCKSVEVPLKISVATILPKVSHSNYQVLFVKLIDQSLDGFSCNDMIKFLDMTGSLSFRKNGTSIGHVLVADMEGATFGHIARINITSARNYLFMLQEAMPIRIKEIHLINVSSIAQKLLSMVKPFLKGEILNTIKVHPSIDSLFDYIPKEALPAEYGGDAEGYDKLIARQQDEFDDADDFFAEEEKEIADESKRIGKRKNINDFFGTEGTFKKLDID